MDGKSAVEVLTKVTCRCLIWFGAWPTLKNKTLSNILFFISVTTVICSVLIPQSIQLIYVWGNIDLMSQIISTAELPYIIALTKMIVLFYNKEKMSILYGHMVDDWMKTKTKDELEIMTKKAEKGKKIAYLCISLGHATMIARLIQWIFENLDNWNNSEHFKNYTLYVEAYYPFTWNYTPLFEITSIMEFFGTYLGMVAYTGTDGFFSQIVLHLSGEYFNLRLKLMDLVNNFNATKFDNEFNKKFGHIVDVHDHLNSCIKILENTFNFMFLVQLLGCSVQFCMQGFLLVMYITDRKSSSMLLDVLFIIVFLMYMIGNFYVYCYLGEQLQMESNAFAETAYVCEWYYLPPQRVKCLVLLMQMGQKPVEVTAGKFCVLNLILFGSIIKTSMGYLSFLVTMRSSK